MKSNIEILKERIAESGSNKSAELYFKEKVHVIDNLRCAGDLDASAAMSAINSGKSNWKETLSFRKEICGF